MKNLGKKQTIFVLIGTVLVLMGGLAVVTINKSQLELKVSGLEESVELQQIQIADYEDLLAEQIEQTEAHKEFIKVLREQSSASAYNFSHMQSLIEEATKNVSDLKKLEEADKELLAKYSKVSFLNEHYEPGSLAYIPSEFVYSERNLQIKTEVQQFLIAMLSAMEEVQLSPRIISAYRSFGYQGNLKHQHSVTYGTSVSNQFVADQGYSEHQLGSTVDIVNTEIGSNMLKFDTTDEYQWLIDNAHMYGFVLSYPHDNEYYKFEPWHWRFVGVSLATSLREQDKHFYDLSQREINQYRLQMFQEGV